MEKCYVCGKEFSEDMLAEYDEKCICWNCYFEMGRDGLFMWKCDAVEVLKILKEYNCEVLETLFDIGTAGKIMYMHGKLRGFTVIVDVRVIFSSDREENLVAAAEEITNYLAKKYGAVTWEEYKILEEKNVEDVREVM